jgi:hypothetical protein
MYIRNLKDKKIKLLKEQLKRNRAEQYNRKWRKAMDDLKKKHNIITFPTCLCIMLFLGIIQAITFNQIKCLEWFLKWEKLKFRQLEDANHWGYGNMHYINKINALENSSDCWIYEEI